MHIVLTFLPITILITLLFLNIFLFENSMSGPNQISLLLASFIAAYIANKKEIRIHTLLVGVKESIASSMNAMIILLIIGGLTSTWILSGVVPAMIYYGMELINPDFFLFTTCVICAIVSLSTGSSWTTAATIGIALMGIGEILGINKGLIAGSIISGAYFGDKMSPLSETTNLAPSVSGSNLIDHIKYMTHTTIPTMIITLILFFFISITSSRQTSSFEETNLLLKTIDSHFYIGLELFILPLIIAILIYYRFSAIKTLSIGLLSGLLFAYLFQHDLINQINIYTSNTTIETMIQTVFYGTDIRTDNELLNDLLIKEGVKGMFWIIMLVITSMTFGGIMYKGGFLKQITGLLLPKSPTSTDLIQSTSASCIFFNITTCDQYMAIVIPGRMFKEIYKDNDLHPVNLSRTIEDSGTVTSVLIPWNSCAAYHSEMLAVSPLMYLPFCFFNIISPFMTLLFAYLNIRIKKIKNDQKK